jgi:hypothetical protein
MKQLIIIVAYINVKDIPTASINKNIQGAKHYFDNLFDEELCEDTNTIIKTLIIPVYDHHTTIECIYPSEPYLPDEIAEKFEQIEITMNNFIQNDSNRS